MLNIWSEGLPVLDLPTFNSSLRFNQLYCRILSLNRPHSCFTTNYHYSTLPLAVISKNRLYY